jgi:hypothetical protein
VTLRWTENRRARYVGATEGPFTLKVFETMLGHASYLVTRDGKLINAGSRASVGEAKAEAEVLVQRLTQG